MLGRYRGVLMAADDAVACADDAMMVGCSFLRATVWKVDGETVYARIDPAHVKPAGLQADEVAIDEAVWSDDPQVRSLWEPKPSCRPLLGDAYGRQPQPQVEVALLREVYEASIDFRRAVLRHATWRRNDPVGRASQRLVDAQAALIQFDRRPG